jgi:Tfp pilus assembly protein PilF
MATSEWLTILNILIAFLGVFVVAFAVFEWHRLRALRRDMASLEKRIERRAFRNMKAAHRVLASYGVADAASRIPLLEAASVEHPQAYNVFNALGYAYMDLKEVDRAIDAFSQAVFHHPEDKAGYCDLAYAHSVKGNDSLCVKYLRKAISVDASALGDIERDARFARHRDAL